MRPWPRESRGPALDAAGNERLASARLLCVQRSELLRSQIDGGGLLQLVSLLALHLTLAAVYGVTAGAAVGWATLVVPLIAAAAAFERSRRTGRTDTLRESVLSAAGACWAFGLVLALLT